MKLFPLFSLVLASSCFLEERPVAEVSPVPETAGRPVAEVGGCSLLRAREPASSRVWSSCGPGCEAIPAAVDPKARVLERGVVAAEYEGEVYVRISSWGEQHGIDEIVRARDGATIFFMQRDRDCMSTAGSGSPGLFRVKRLGAASAMEIGVLAPPFDGELRWQPIDARPGAQHGAVEPFMFEGGAGAIVDHTRVELAGLGDLSKRIVFETPAPQLHPRGRDRLVAWADFSEWSLDHRARVRVWSADDGAIRTLEVPGRDAVELAISADKIVWLAASGKKAIEGAYEDVRVFWIDRANFGVIHEGPQIPGAERGTGALVAFGDRAATMVSIDGETRVAMIELGGGGGAVQLIAPPESGRRWLSILAMNDAGVLVSDAGQGRAREVSRIVRLSAH